ncbi:hypothetical protein K502DRAFT_329037 [Neoconidiobolus thromboides FSU 785]|nr:hypothetical protein K502DRAFT_329037 [Neoconidiobolus thromboides FSU 785]
MANRLLSLRGNVVVGRTWVYSFVKRQPKLYNILKKRLNRDKSSSPEIVTSLDWIPKAAENLNEITEQVNFMKHQVKNHYIESPTLLNKAIELFEENNKKALHQIALQLKNEELEKTIESHDKSI